jgi:ribosomal protein S18 acetylase RimI-like enzyme
LTEPIGGQAEAWPSNTVNREQVVGPGFSPATEGLATAEDDMGTSDSGIVVRAATVADAEHVARLVSALGYLTSPAQMATRLESIFRDEDFTTLVAALGERIVGFIGTRVGPFYESDGIHAQIMALAVAADHQQHGVGRMLMDAAESMLAGRGVSVVVVTSGNHRDAAHAFYEKSGYTFTGRRYRKQLNR